jgi:site-specific DNA recombinase
MSRRAGLYLRISEDRSDDRLALTRQEEDGLALIKRRGWEHVDTYREAISAKRYGRRPEFDRLLRDVESGRINAIVVWDFTRLHRNRRDELRVVETCQPRETIIAPVRGSDLDMSTAAGRLSADIMGSVARHEIDQKSERQRRQIAQAAQAGKPHSGRRPFGYKRNGIDHHPVEAPIVEEMFSRFLAGARLGEVAQWLREIGMKTPQGSAWDAESVKTVLRNPRYAGIRGTRGEVNGRRAEWYAEIAPAIWPPIITEEAWRATVERLRGARHAPEARRPGPPLRYLLSGIGRCGICGNRVVSGSIRNPSERARVDVPSVRTYQCLPTKHLSRQAQLIDDYVSRAAVHRLTAPDAAGLLLRRDEVEVRTLQIAALAVRERLRGFARAYAAGDIDYDQMVTGSAGAKTRLAELEAQIAAAGQVDVLAPLVLAESIEAVWCIWNDEMPMSTKRAIVDRLFVVTIHRGRIGRPPTGLLFDPASVSIEPNLAGGSPSSQPEPSA